MRKSTGWEIGSLGWKGIALRYWGQERTCGTLMAKVWFSRVHLGAVSGQFEQCKTGYGFGAGNWYFGGSKGPGYRSDAVFDLRRMEPYSLSKLLSAFEPCSESIALYLPRTSNVKQLAAKTLIREVTGVTHYCMEGASKVRGYDQIFALMGCLTMGTGHVCLFWQMEELGIRTMIHNGRSSFGEANSISLFCTLLRQR